MIPRPQRSVSSLGTFGHSASFDSPDLLLLETAEDAAALEAVAEARLETQSETGARQRPAAGSPASSVASEQAALRYPHVLGVFSVFFPICSFLGIY